MQTGTVYLNLEFKGDTVINGKDYKALHKYYRNAINEENDTIPIYLREENKLVYGIVPDGRTYADCPIGNICEGGVIFEDIRDGNEFVLYDFQDPVAYWDSHYNVSPYYQLLSIDTIAIGNHHVKQYVNTLGGPEPFYIIEGIGIDAPGDSYTLFPCRPGFTGYYDTSFHLSHVIENGEIIYKGIYYDPDNMTGIDEVVADQRPRQYDDNYYNLMGQPVGKALPTTPGIYIHHGNKICVSRMP